MGMMEDRELSGTDHPTKSHGRLKAIAIPAVLGPLLGFLISYAFTPKYTSQARIVVETETEPPEVAQPAVPFDTGQHIATLEYQVLSQNRLQPMVERLGLATGGESVEQAVKKIWQNARIDTVVTGPGQNGTVGAEEPRPNSEVARFYVEYTDSTPEQAQKVCHELTSMLLVEDQKAREQVAESAAESLRRLDEAKRNLDEQDSKLASFKKQHSSHLPGDSESSTTMLMVLNAQLNALSQWINLTQQNKSNAESILGQQPTNPKSPPAPARAAPAALQKQLSDLQSQLLQLQAQYTEDHPDVVKTKADIAEIKKELAEANAADGTGADRNPKPDGAEPPEIRRLRLQVDQYDETIAKATRQQKSIEAQIKRYQGRVLESSSVEAEYQRLSADDDTAQESYQNLLAKSGAMQNGGDSGGLPQSERMRLANAANLPAIPRFPDRRLFAAGGLGSGLALGLGIALWLDVRNRAIRPRPYW
jgi:succinoglycan biosynthesis transport protein ExoP